MLNRRRFAGLAAAALAAPSIVTSRAFGADWPARPVRVVVPFTPGGSTDITARLVSNRLQEVWGQTVVIENKPGAGGNIAADMVAHSDADGYTIFITGPGMATNPFLYPQLSYDPVADFAPGLRFEPLAAAVAIDVIAAAVRLARGDAAASCAGRATASSS